MKVILLQDVKALGKKGDVVNVSDGYARNAIFPKKLGVEANAKNLNDLKLQNQHADKVAQENYEAALAMAENLKDKKVTAAYKQYTTDYHYKKMLKELVARGFLMSEIGYNKRTFVSCKLDMKGLEDAIINYIQNKSLNYKVKQVENNRLQALNSIKRRLNKQSS